MFESLAAQAFSLGIISAFSLLIGAIVSFFWRPRDRTIAFMMAVGGGALLAALTLDLVGEALERGHYLSLCAGCLIGGSLFTLLDRIVDDYGGFMRKAATTIYHVRRQNHTRYKKILSGIGRTDIFKHLATRHYKALSNSILSQEYKKGESIYQPGDPADSFLIVLSGGVELYYPAKEHKNPKTIGKNEAFGRLAFITGAPYGAGAQTSMETTVLKIPRDAFNALLLNSSTVQQVVHRWLRSSDLLNYLRLAHKMPESDARKWIDNAVQTLINRGHIPPAVYPKRYGQEFAQIANQIDRIHLFDNLTARELEEICSRLRYRHFAKGESLFHNGDRADRMFILHRGEVSLIDATNSGRKSMQLLSNDGFGFMSFITGANHTVSALATQDSDVWFLHRSDCDELLLHSQGMRDRIRQFLQQDELSSYLLRKLHFDNDKASRFIQSCLKAIDHHQPLPEARTLTLTLESHSGAAVAIWLGILLDGIPESLVIGSSMINAKVSMSLLIGLFIANFPEALSSAIGMRQQGFSKVRILLMWTSIVLLTGIGAACGSIFFIGAKPFVYALVEGIAAGAMLTMIAQTMMPEAYFKGGSIVGFATLIGFLAAIGAKTLH